MAASYRRTILVAEDEPAVRNLIVTVLEREDYRLLEADSSAEALRILSSFEGVIELLIADHLLKTLSGRQLAEQIQQSRPRLKVLHISGYSEKQVREEEGFMPNAHFRAKPFMVEALAEKVRQIVGSAIVTPI